MLRQFKEELSKAKETGISNRLKLPKPVEHKYFKLHLFISITVESGQLAHTSTNSTGSCYLSPSHVPGYFKHHLTKLPLD